MVNEKYIVHVDMDAFFAAIEQRDNPALAGKPVVVGADPKCGAGRGVVSTCSYEARKFGIHSAMPISSAYSLCPWAIYLPVDMKKYNRVSEQIYRILENFTPCIEPVSIDEAFLDITASFHLFGSPRQVCRLIKEKIKKQTQLTASVGLAPTKMAAKIASELSKPDGLLEIKPQALLDFLRPLPVDRIWGLGKKSKEILDNLGIKTIGDLAKKSKEDLILLFGKSGEHFWYLAQGLDERMVSYEDQEKSISNEVTFEQDSSDRFKIEKTLLCLSEKVCRRLRIGGYKAKTVTVKIRLKGFLTYTRAMTLNQATNFDDVIYRTAKKLYSDFSAQGKKIRLVGIRLSNFMPVNIQDTIFQGVKESKRQNFYKAIDAIKDKFGPNTIKRAAVLESRNEENLY